MAVILRPEDRVLVDFLKGHMGVARDGDLIRAALRALRREVDRTAAALSPAVHTGIEG